LNLVNFESIRIIVSQEQLQSEGDISYDEYYVGYCVYHRHTVPDVILTATVLSHFCLWQS